MKVDYRIGQFTELAKSNLETIHKRLKNSDQVINSLIIEAVQVAEQKNKLLVTASHLAQARTNLLNEQLK